MTALRTWLVAWFWARWSALWTWADRELVHTPPPRELAYWAVSVWEDHIIPGRFTCQIYRDREWFAGAVGPSPRLACRLARLQARHRLRALRALGRGDQVTGGETEQVQA